MKTEPRVTRGRKFNQVLDGARTVFLRDGFEGASVDDIAREAGVSKATLYSYFPDKRLMFAEVFRAELQRESSMARGLVDIELPAAQVLPFIVQLIAAHLVGDFGVRAFRLSVAEAERFPALAAEYYETGPVLLRNMLCEYLTKAVGRGELQIDDLELAADQLIELSSASIHDRAMMLGPASVDEAHLRRTVDGAVRVFMAAYGVRPADAAS
ncbi:TetR/AcrR family transcriptional regulator [Paracoccus jiaweipingae]|uniref:TetR/AcrR family transcriptional regulator n=1 Tax=unclassified Paracoccus (in: a-proteobacteria) TaxID=2688777 RepID=UPI0037A78E97